MQIDTGASFSAVSEETFKGLIINGQDLPLEGFTSHLQTYSGDCLPVLGKVKVNVRVNGQEAVLPFDQRSGS